VSCEDYGLLYRLTERNQGPVLRLSAESEALGEIPVSNVIAEIKGSSKPDEYVLLSAHFDSWDGGSGSTDNGTGTITMLEAMRILKAAYPLDAWSGTGREGWASSAHGLAEDHPAVRYGRSSIRQWDRADREWARSDSSARALLLAGLASCWRLIKASCSPFPAGRRRLDNASPASWRARFRWA
jgi:hypothetical protein